mmetsp:Transcript_163831/g.520719  ORF Transcript_163831/g.520719 Transcript_163831/m.520719 type:complete len:300 (-) Transcript_163831:32-931(-)
MRISGRCCGEMGRVEASGGHLEAVGRPRVGWRRRRRREQQQLRGRRTPSVGSAGAGTRRRLGRTRCHRRPGGRGERPGGAAGGAVGGLRQANGGWRCSGWQRRLARRCEFVVWLCAGRRRIGVFVLGAVAGGATGRPRHLRRRIEDSDPRHSCPSTSSGGGRSAAAAAGSSGGASSSAPAPFGGGSGAGGGTGSFAVGQPAVGGAVYTLAGGRIELPPPPPSHRGAGEDRVGDEDMFSDMASDGDRSMPDEVDVPLPGVTLAEGISQMASMGFPEDSARGALEASNGDVDAAVALLLDG